MPVKDYVRRRRRRQLHSEADGHALHRRAVIDGDLDELDGDIHLVQPGLLVRGPPDLQVIHPRLKASSDQKILAGGRHGLAGRNRHDSAIQQFADEPELGSKSQGSNTANDQVGHGGQFDSEVIDVTTGSEQASGGIAVHLGGDGQLRGIGRACRILPRPGFQRIESCRTRMPTDLDVVGACGERAGEEKIIPADHVIIIFRNQVAIAVQHLPDGIKPTGGADGDIGRGGQVDREVIDVGAGGDGSFHRAIQRQVRYRGPVVAVVRRRLGLQRIKSCRAPASADLDVVRAACCECVDEGKIFRIAEEINIAVVVLRQHIAIAVQQLPHGINSTIDADMDLGRGGRFDREVIDVGAGADISQHGAIQRQGRRGGPVVAVVCGSCRRDVGPRPGARSVRCAPAPVPRTANRPGVR